MLLHFLYYIHYISTSILKYLFLSEWLTIFYILVYYFDYNIPPFKTQPNYLKHWDNFFLTKKYQPDLFKEKNY